MAKKRIMVVDDERYVVKVVKMILESENFDVMPTYSGKECLDKLEKEKPDLILLDIMMPGMNGWETYERIREVNENQKVIFLTAVGAPNSEPLAAASQKFHVPKAKKLGAADYITKPFDKEDLVKRVKRVFGE